MKRGENGSFLGSLQDFSVYRRKDIDADLIRSKGGPTQQQIDTWPSLRNTKKAGKEFGGRAKMAACINKVILPIKPLLDHNITAPVNSLLIPVQKLDILNDPGKRNLQLTLAPGILEGYQLNRRNPLETIIMTSFAAQMNRSTLEAMIAIPPLVPQNNFYPIGNLPFYRIVATMGVVPDLFFEKISGYRPPGDYNNLAPAIFIGTWEQVNKTTDPVNIHLQLPMPPPNEAFSMFLAAGISFGRFSEGGIEALKGAGAGKILRVV